METIHKILIADSRSLDDLKDNSVNLIITSPPYPMISMWDKTFTIMNNRIQDELNNNNDSNAFDLMHDELDKVWEELNRVLKFNGIICINIGDATRTFNNIFQLYPNAERIANKFRELGFNFLPKIIWRKQTNAPNKFMGSGMLPCGAYVTLEHEYILIFRKAGKRNFNNEIEIDNRYESAFFWEERNNWFSDIWYDLKGTNQSFNQKTNRDRSGAYPFELAYRLINMYSTKGDVILDPFLGTGTSTLAAIAAARNSIGIELDSSLRELIIDRIRNEYKAVNKRIQERIQKHIQFVYEYEKNKHRIKYQNKNYNFPVMTKQERSILFDFIDDINIVDNKINIQYSSAIELAGTSRIFQPEMF